MCQAFLEIYSCHCPNKKQLCEEKVVSQSCLSSIGHGKVWAETKISVEKVPKTLPSYEGLGCDVGRQEEIEAQAQGNRLMLGIPGLSVSWEGMEELRGILGRWAFGRWKALKALKWMLILREMYSRDKGGRVVAMEGVEERLVDDQGRRVFGLRDSRNNVFAFAHPYEWWAFRGGNFLF
jgi:hypothetical protein